MNKIEQTLRRVFDNQPVNDEKTLNQRLALLHKFKKSESKAWIASMVKMDAIRERKRKPRTLELNL